MRRVANGLIVLAVLVTASAASAAELGALADGLHTWTIDDTADVYSCCFSHRRGGTASGGCNIDGRSLSITTDGNCATGPGAAQVYVRVADGKPARVWVLSSNCSVTAESTIEDHGLVSAAESVEWFRSVIENQRANRDVREQTLFALVQTESDAAFRYLDRLLTDR